MINNIKDNYKRKRWGNRNVEIPNGRRPCDFIRNPFQNQKEILLSKATPFEASPERQDPDY